MTDKYQGNIDHYIAYYTDIIGHIDIYLQEDQLMRTKLRFPLVPVLIYVPSTPEMELSTVRQIEETARADTKCIEGEMQVIMNEHQENQKHDVANASFSSSFSRIRSDKLNDMGYGLSRISPITFEGDIFQTPKNKTQEVALMWTPRKHRNSAINKIFPVEQVPRHEEQPRLRSYDAKLSATVEGGSQPLGRFIPPHPTNADNFAGGSLEIHQI